MTEMKCFIVFPSPSVLVIQEVYPVSIAFSMTVEPDSGNIYLEKSIVSSACAILYSEISVFSSSRRGRRLIMRHFGYVLTPGQSQRLSDTVVEEHPLA